MTLRLAYRLVEGDRAILELLLHREENGEDERDNRCPIYTYFETFAQWQPQEDQMELIRIWMRSWYSGGFRPIILLRKDAEGHPSFVEFSNKVATFPTTNPPEYELACYIRWLAFAQAGGGTFIDYDILPLSRFRLPEKAAGCGRKGSALVSYERYVPMLVHANVTGVERMINLMLHHEVCPSIFILLQTYSLVLYIKFDPVNDVVKGRPLLSDMRIMRLPDSLRYFEVIAPPPDDIVVHFSTYHLAIGRAGQRGLSKFQWANSLRALHVANTRNIILHVPLELKLKGLLGFPECPMTAQDQDDILPPPHEQNPNGKAMLFPGGLHCGVSLREGFELRSKKKEEGIDDEVHILVLHRRSSCLGAARLLQRYGERALPVLLGDWESSKLLLEFSFGMIFEEEPKYQVTAPGSCPLYDHFSKMLQRRTRLPRQTASQIIGG